MHKQPGLFRLGGDVLTYDEKLKMFNETSDIVYFIVRKHWGRSYVPEEDLIQEGMLVLWESTERYDPSKHAKFSTYAFAAIKNRLDRYTWANNFGSMTKSSLFQESIPIVRYAQEHEVSIDDACDALNVKGVRREYATIIFMRAEIELSLYDKLDGGWELADTVADDYNLEDVVCDTMFSRQIISMLYTDFVEYCVRKHTGKIPGYYRDLIKLFLDSIFNDHITQLSIGQRLGLSRAVVNKQFKNLHILLKQYTIMKNVCNKLS